MNHSVVVLLLPAQILYRCLRLGLKASMQQTHYENDLMARIILIFLVSPFQLPRHFQLVNQSVNRKFKVSSAEHCSHCTEKTKDQEKKEKSDVSSV